MPPALLIGLIVVLGAGTVGALIWLFAGSSNASRDRLAALAPAQVVSQQGARDDGPRADTVPALTQALRETDWWHDMQLQLIRGGWMLRPSEFVAISAGLGLVATGIFALILHNILQALVLGAVIALVPNALLKSNQQKRLAALTAQVPDALDMLAGSMRAGCALLRAMQVVRSQMHPPISEEFGRVVDEVSYGANVTDALGNMVVRTGSYDLELIVAAIQTQLTVGGNLAEIFDNIAVMIRERVKLIGELQTATAEGRMSALILLAMPFILAFGISVISPDYLLPLFHEKLGLILLGVGVFLMVVGSLIIRKLIDIDI